MAPTVMSSRTRLQDADAASIIGPLLIALRTIRPAQRRHDDAGDHTVFQQAEREADQGSEQARHQRHRPPAGELQHEGDDHDR